MITHADHYEARSYDITKRVFVKHPLPNSPATHRRTDPDADAGRRSDPATLPKLDMADEIARRLPYDRWRLVPIESSTNPFGVDFSWSVNLYDSPIHKNSYTHIKTFFGHTISEVLAKVLDYLIEVENYKVPNL